ncbi:MAG: hypothetical protein OYK82_00940 [Gammaproteobacteria bacterium]|nr:hypothetical protein [Gammaproteobacteria bacterium]
MPRPVKTSATDPIRIAAVRAGDGLGRIGVTLCPGKTDPRRMFASWKRDLSADLDAIRDWGATAVVSMITRREIECLGVGGLGQTVADRQMEWLHLPVIDGTVPGPDFERQWAVDGEALRDRLRLGFDILVHCRGGWAPPGPSPPVCWWSSARTRRTRSAACATSGRAPSRRRMCGPVPGRGRYPGRGPGTNTVVHPVETNDFGPAGAFPAMMYALRFSRRAYHAQEGLGSPPLTPNRRRGEGSPSRNAGLTRETPGRTIGA